MKLIQRFALVFGVIYVLAGIAGFVPGLVHEHADHPRLAVDAGYGLLLGLFPINILHNLVHILIGVWGLLSFRSFAASLLFARGLAVFYGLLALLGLIPATSTMFGLVPIFGHDIWLHAASALVAAYFGFLMPAETTVTDHTTTPGTPALHH